MAKLIRAKPKAVCPYCKTVCTKTNKCKHVKAFFPLEDVGGDMRFFFHFSMSDEFEKAARRKKTIDKKMDKLKAEKKKLKK